MTKSADEILFNAVCVLNNYVQRYEDAARAIAQLGMSGEAITLKLVASVLARACDDIIDENWEAPEGFDADEKEAHL